MVKIRFSWRTFLIILVVWFIAFSFLFDFWPLVRSDGEWNTVTHTQLGFSLDYPTKWKVRKYDEDGFKGDDEVRLRIFRSSLGEFVIRIRYRAASNPTLADVVSWSNERINGYRLHTIEQEKIGYNEIEFRDDIVNSKPVKRRVYQLNDLMIEEVYIARDHDMIIITLQTPINDFEDNLNDFEAIIASFRPMD